MISIIKKYFWRVVISTIGISMIMSSLFFVTLGMIGEETYGFITTYRRILGERGEVIPNRYTYSLGYKFYVDDTEYSGSTTVINSPLFIKPDGKSLIQISYLSSAPYLSSVTSETQIDMGKFALVSFGILLVVVMNPSKKSKRNKKSLLYTHK